MSILIGSSIFISSIMALGLGVYFKQIPAYYVHNAFYRIICLMVLMYEVQQDGWIGIFRTLTIVLFSVAYLLAFLKGYKTNRH